MSDAMRTGSTAATPDVGYDVVVVGGGAAGLSAALMLARARRAVLVVDAGRPRNAPAAHLHNYLSRDGAAPSELLAAGRDEVAGYGGHIMTGTVVSATRLAAGDFRIFLEDGSSVRARRLLAATGLVDELPDVPGVAERWGRDVLHCPYCHGWEVRDRAIGVLATGPMAVHAALLWRQWTTDVIMFRHTAPELDDADREKLAARGVAMVDGTVAGLEVRDDRLAGVRLAGGEVVERDALVVLPHFTTHADILTTLGLSATEQRMGDHVIGTYIAADRTGATAVPGVWVAGNVADPMDQLINAAAAGARSGAAINADLVAEDTARALDRYRTATASAAHVSVEGASA
jgi:thioredoxin reductase